jgi:ribonuclease P protein component
MIGKKNARTAVLRNAVKRRIREQFRLRQTALPASQYVVRLSIAITTKDVAAVIAEWTGALEHDIAKLAKTKSAATMSPGVNV